MRRETSPWSGCDQERRDHELALGEVLERAEVDLVGLLVDERGQDGEAEHGQRHDRRRSPRRGRASRARGTRCAGSRSSSGSVAGGGRRDGDRRLRPSPARLVLRLLGTRASRRAPRGTRRRARSPAPMATTDQLTISPTRRQTMPTANPTGHRLGGGECGFETPPVVRHASADSIGSRRAVSTT